MTTYPRTWRPLRPDEQPVSGVGVGPEEGSGEVCCPYFDTWAPYEIVWVDGIGRAAKQDPHVLLAVDAVCECACGERFRWEEKQLRKVR